MGCGCGKKTQRGAVVTPTYGSYSVEAALVSHIIMILERKFEVSPECPDIAALLWEAKELKTSLLETT